MPHSVLPPDVRVMPAESPTVHAACGSMRTEVVAPGSAARPTRMNGVEVRRVFDRVRSVAVENCSTARL
jgi:hypothetical protein